MCVVLVLWLGRGKILISSWSYVWVERMRLIIDNRKKREIFYFFILISVFWVIIVRKRCKFWKYIKSNNFLDLLLRNVNRLDIENSILKEVCSKGYEIEILFVIGGSKWGRFFLVRS